MSLLNRLEPYLRFSKNEKRGIIVLVSLLLLVILIRILLPAFLPQNSTEIEFGYVELQKAQENQQRTELVYRKKTDKKESSISLEIIPDYFNPNRANYEELVRVGFSGRTANTIVKYRKSGGIFKENIDLFKIYGIDSTYSNLINKYCKIDSEEIAAVEIQRKKFKESLKIDINSADTSKLIQLPGIGKVLSERIIRYRNALGGFTNEEQLLEVYGIKEESYNNFISYIIIDSNAVSKLYLNTATEADLKQHPYINNYQSRAIVKYREIVGNFENPNEILQNYILTQEEFDKVNPYLSVD